VHVGDSLAEDVEGARAAGIEPVLLVRSGGSGGSGWSGRSGSPVPSGVRVIRSLRELERGP
jgi:FMN phosphatase YigB (HAD superfamily)